MIYSKFRVFLQKSIHHNLIFFGFQAAYGVYQNAAGLQERGTSIQQGELPGAAIVYIFWHYTSFAVRVFLQYAQPAARRIKQNTVEFRGLEFRTGRR